MLSSNPWDRANTPSPKEHIPLLPQDWANSSIKPYPQTHYWAGSVYYASPLSVLSSGPGPKGISLTSSIKSRLNTYLESDSLPKPEVSPRHANPQPNNAHRDPATNMKSPVNQKLSDFNIKGALQILSGDSSFVNPSKESLDTLQQKHPMPHLTLCFPFPKRSHSTNILQSKPNTGCNLFLPPWLRGRLRRTETTTFERLHINLCRWCQHFSPHQPNWIS